MTPREHSNECKCENWLQTLGRCLGFSCAVAAGMIILICIVASILGGWDAQTNYHGERLDRIEQQLGLPKYEHPPKETR